MRQEKVQAKVEHLQQKVGAAQADRAAHDGPQGARSKPLGLKNLGAHLGRNVASGLVNGAATALGGTASAMEAVADKARQSKDNYDSTLARRHVNFAKESHKGDRKKFTKLDALHSSLQQKLISLQTQLQALQGLSDRADDKTMTKLQARLEKAETELAELEPRWERATRKKDRMKEAVDAHRALRTRAES